MKSNKVKAALWIFLPFLAFAIGAFAGDRSAEIDQIFEQWQKPDSPGCALAVVQNGKIIYTRGYGMADLEHDVPLRPNAVFRIASTSKQFTAMCILLLEKEGKLSLDDDIRKFLPEIPDYGSSISIRHLLHHTSGIRDYLTLQWLAGKSDFDYYTAGETVELLARQKELNFPPGEKFLYSNSGYFLLGVIVERVVGKSLREFAQESIFEPLGMQNTRFQDDHTRIVKNRAIGYSFRDGEFHIDMTTLDIVGDGGVFTTVEDLFLWDQNFYHPKVGGKDVIRKMLRPGILNDGTQLDYACGLRVASHCGLRMVSHGGAFVGYRAQMIRFPDQRFTVICLANLSSIHPTERCLKVADLFLADQFTAAEIPEIPEQRGAAPFSARELGKLAGVYFDENERSLVEIAFENDTLWWNQDDLRIPLIPIGKNIFRIQHRYVSGRIEFVEAKSPERRSLVFQPESGRALTYVLIKPVTPSANQLREYPGVYFSEELNTNYRLVLQNGKLYLQHRNLPQQPMQPILVDWFKLKELYFQFVRDRDGNIAGFRLSAGRVKNLWFAAK